MKNNLQIIGISLMIAGIIVAIIGFGLFANLVCHCPAQITGQSSTCHCGEYEIKPGYALLA